MLWLCVAMPQLGAELHALEGHQPCAVFDRQGARRWLIACNARAQQLGLKGRLDVTAALARVPQLMLLPRSRAKERAALQALAGWAEQYSSSVCMDETRWLLWIEIGGSVQYFGSADALINQVQAGIAALGYKATLGVAPTLEAAALFANAVPERRVPQLASLPLALASLPIGALPITPAIITTLQGIGWNYLGEVLAVPDDQLARRFGPAFTDYLHRLTGAQPDTRALYRAPTIYRRRVDLPAATASLEALLFPLRRMLGELHGYMLGRDTALQQLTLQLGHRKQADTQIVLNTSTPLRDAARLLDLLREHLARAPLPLPTEAITLLVEHCVALGDTQLDLFNTGTRHEQQWRGLLDKLRARLGDQAVRVLQACDDHRPEHAWCSVSPGQVPASRPSLEADACAERPLWLLPAKPLATNPKLLGKPERIESGWWSGDDVRRDYYLAETQDGSRWWVYRDVVSQQWFLQGLWA